MSSRGHARWLLAEIVGWHERGWLDDAQARQLHDQYAPLAESRVDAGRLLVWLGTAGLAAGGLLLVAANWDQFSRAGRSAAAVALLAAAQAGAAVRTRVAGGAAVRTRVAGGESGPAAPGSEERGRAAGELIALGWCAAVIACLALISQTWQLQGDAGRFLWTCIWMCIPIAWLCGAHTPVALCLWLTAAWAGQPSASDGGFWLLMAAQGLRVLWLRPRLVGELASAPIGWPWVGLLLYGVAARLGLEHEAFGGWTVLAAGCLAWVATEPMRAPAGSAARAGSGAPTGAAGASPAEAAFTPFDVLAARRVAGLVIAASLVAGGFAEPFAALFDSAALRADLPWNALIAAAVGAVSLALGVRAAASGDPLRLAVLGAPWVVAALGAIALASGLVAELAVGVTALAVALGAAAIATGAAREDPSRVRAGLALVGLVAAARFLAADWSFTARALGFMVGGVALLAAARASRRLSPEARS